MVMYEGKEKPELALDNSQEQNFCSAYAKLPPTPAGTVRLFNRQDFYSAHGSDALYVADNYYKTQTVLKYLGKNKLPSCTMNNTVALTFARELLTEKQMRIEIYENVKGTWKLGKSASPGNMVSMEDMLFHNTELRDQPVIVAVKLGTRDANKLVGVAFADTSLQELGVAEFVDNDLFSNLESLLIQLSVKEVILPESDKTQEYDINKIKVLIARCNIVLTERPRGEFNGKDAEQDLNNLLRDHLKAELSAHVEKKVAMGAIAGLIAYLGLLSDETHFGNYKLKAHDLSQYMKLDASALRALNLLPEISGPAVSSHPSKSTSLFGLLDHTCTAQGSRLLNQYIKQPLMNVAQIKERQELVECLVETTSLRTDIQSLYLKAMPDFIRLCRKFLRGLSTLEDVVRVYQAILLLPGLSGTLDAADFDNDVWKTLITEKWLTPLNTLTESLEPYREMVETTIDLNELERNNYVIKPDFDDTLKGIMDRVSDVRDSLDGTHEEVARDLSLATDNKVLHFEQHLLYGYCFRLTRKEAGIIRNRTRYVELKSQSNGIYFTTKALRELNDEYKDLMTAYDRKQHALVKEVTSIAASYCPVLETLNNVLARIDVIASLASAASAGRYVRPTVQPAGEGDLVLLNARHPCLEMQDGIAFIANDIEMRRGSSEFQIITGPNMGGKSTYIRQTGVIALMSQIGSFVPCDSAVVPVFDSVLCRVGAGDNQIKGVSTFMAEMLETVAIVEGATSKSLVIIDELGRGTSTYDGFGLAWAISEHLAKDTRAFVMFATHFHELTSLAQEVPTVDNFHVSAHVEEHPDSITGKDITLLYKVQPGTSDQSFGIHVAELAQFPEEVVRLAKRKADLLEDFDATSEKRVNTRDIEKGTKIVLDMLAEWETAKASGESAEQQVEQFRSVLDKYKPQLEGNEWYESLMLSS